MKIKVWGCRGSIPTPGRQTVAYGGNTTCLEVRLNDNTLIIIDAGSGIRQLGKRILKEHDLTEIYLFLTHAHWDHITGFPLFLPAHMSKYKIHVFGCDNAMYSLKDYMKHQMAPPYFPVKFDMLNAEFDFAYDSPEGAYISSARLTKIPLNHLDGGCGLKITENGKTFVFLTDNELDYKHVDGMTRDDYANFSMGANLLMHDSQYTDEEYKKSKGWGHTSLSSATKLSIAARVERFGLIHHDPDHTDENIDDFVVSCQEQIADAKSDVDCFGVSEEMEIIV